MFPQYYLKQVMGAITSEGRVAFVCQVDVSYVKNKDPHVTNMHSFYYWNEISNVNFS